MGTGPSVARTECLNGMQMYCELRGEGAPLVLLHGFTGAGADWQLVFQEPPEAYRLVIPDLRGHGRSTNPSAEFTFRQCALDVLALLDRLGIERFQAIGLSGGAQILLHQATQQPTRVEAMVLVSTAPYFPAQARAIMREVSVESRSQDDWRAMRQRHHHGEAQIRALWGHAHALQDSYEDVNFTPPLLARIMARTLIVHGDRDPLYPVSLAVDMHAAILGSYLWVIPNGGHGPIFGDRAEGFRENALAFLRGAWKGPEAAFHPLTSVRK